MEREGQRNWVLNLNTMAIAALRRGDRDLAIRALDESILQIEIIYGDSSQARRARSLFYSEDSKIFKGDPYERSMVYFYRGVLYMQDRVWDNARACFRSALYHDAIAEDEQDQADWTIFYYLISLCETQMGNEDAARDAFRFASDTYKTFPERYGTLETEKRIGARRTSRLSRLRLQENLVPYAPKTNLVVLVQTGKAPVKAGVGKHGQQLAFAPGGSGNSAAKLVIDGKVPAFVQVTDSVYYQAVTRGGRELDSILGRQAKFKEGTGTVGTGATIAGAVVLADAAGKGSSQQALVGGAILATGLLLNTVSSITKPKADTRCWRSLPDAIGVFAGRIAAGDRELSIEFLGEGRGLTSRRVTVGEAGEDLEVVLVFPPPNPIIAVSTDRIDPQSTFSPDTQTN